MSGPVIKISKEEKPPAVTLAPTGQGIRGISLEKPNVISGRKKRTVSIASSGSDSTVNLQRKKDPPLKQMFQSAPAEKSRGRSGGQGSRPQEQNHDYSAFSNPVKSRAAARSEYSSDDDHSVDRRSWSGSEKSYESDAVRSFLSEDADKLSAKSEEAFRPSPSGKKYRSETEEKQDLLIKLNALADKAGMQLTRKYTMSSTLEDIRMEYRKQRDRLETEASVKFSQRMLMACITGIEFLNKRFDPVGAKLEGWSESVMEGITDYDGIFERLAEKYKGTSEMAPELELLLALGGSAFMFHLTSTLFKSSVPGFGDMAKNNPDFMNNIAQAFQNMQQRGPVPANAPQGGFGAPSPNMGNRPPMAPPFDISAVLGQTVIGGRGPSVIPSKRDFANSMRNPPPYPVPTRQKPEKQPNIPDSDRFSVASDTSSKSGERTVSITKDKKSKKGGFVIDLSSPV